MRTRVHKDIRGQVDSVQVFDCPTTSAALLASMEYLPRFGSRDTENVRRRVKAHICKPLGGCVDAFECFAVYEAHDYRADLRKRWATFKTWGGRQT